MAYPAPHARGQCAPRYNDGAGLHNGSRDPRYRQDHRGHDSLYPRSGRGRGQQPFDNYQPQEEYVGYNQNPWYDGTEGYNNSHGPNNARYWKEQDGIHYSEHSRQKPRGSNENYAQDMDVWRQQDSQPAPPQNRGYCQDDYHDQSVGNSQSYRQQNKAPASNVFLPSEQANRPDYGYEADQGNLESARRAHNIGTQPQGHYTSNEVDTLPRYLNSTVSRRTPVSDDHAGGGHGHQLETFDALAQHSMAQRGGFQMSSRKQGARISPPRPSRISDEKKSPDTLSWDNPFPTFRDQSKKGLGGSLDHHPLTGKTSLEHGDPQHRLQTYPKQNAVRPQNPASPRNIVADVAQPTEHGYAQAVFDGTGARVNVERDGIRGLSNVHPELSGRRPYLGNPATTAKELDRQAHSDSHLETIESQHPHTRLPNEDAMSPSKENNMSSKFAFERSRTMPTAISGPVPESGLILADDDPPAWQEPGAVSGYYGPQDHNYLPDRSVQGAPQRPRALSRSQTDDPRHGNGSVARRVETNSSNQAHLPQASYGLIQESHDEFTQDPFQRHPQEKSRQRSSPADDEMPNFDAVPRLGGQLRGLTMDEHLQSSARQPERPPQMQRHADPYSLNQREDLYQEQYPRSRSQPNFMEVPPQARRYGDSDSPAPGPPDRRPATSAASRNDQRSGFRPPPNHSARGPMRPTDPTLAANFDPRRPTRPPDSRRPDLGMPLDDGHRSPSAHSGRSTPGAFPPRDQSTGSEVRRFRYDPRPPDRQRSPPALTGRPHDDRERQSSSTSLLTAAKQRHPSLDKALPNPDSLPHHPAPVRLGLASAQSSGQPARPAPVRQYSAPPLDPVQQPPNEKRGSGKVTFQELEDLRQRTHRSPNDSATQLLLAQKLVEASDVLIDDRADPNTKKRNREKYQSDALKIVKKLSALSYADADFYYGDCYSRGALGLQPDIREAFLLYQKAAKANHGQAAYRVAVCCELGQEEGGGTKRDAVKAMQWYRRAAALGDVAAMYKIGVILLKGLLGQPRNASEGISFLKQAAERADKENPHALHELALLHEKPTGIEGIRPDETYSRQLLTQSANLGYKFSQFRLGSAYEYGALGYPVDPRQSIAWYSKAAVQEEHQSELALSGWYLTGSEGVLQQSDTEAYLWARKAAHAGLAKAEYAMGYFTEVGIGAPANLEDAKRWYWKSASQNFPKARDRLEDLRKGGGPKQKTRVSRSKLGSQSDGECTVM